MKNTLLPILLLILTFSSCDDRADEVLIKPETYEGVFYRTIDGVQQEISSVTLNLDGNTFEGNSGVAYYPAIGKGTYTLNDNLISFQDKGPWLAHFEWSYILDGDFIIAYQDDKLYLTKNIGDNIVDTYVFNYEGVLE